jgi:RING-variant domain
VLSRCTWALNASAVQDDDVIASAQRGMQNFVPARLASLFTSRGNRDSEDGTALLRSSAESSQDGTEQREDNVVVDITREEVAEEEERDGVRAHRIDGNGGDPDEARTSRANRTECNGASTSLSDQISPAGFSGRTDSSVNCLICLDPIDVTDTRNVVTLGCSCKGPAALRHKACLDQWLTVKGDTTCDVCGGEMNVPLPPPPPVPGFVVFPELEHSFEVQWGTFSRYLWHNAIAVVIYCFVLALIMDIPLHIAMLIALVVLVMIFLRYVMSVCVNTIARRPVLTFQVPETS